MASYDTKALAMSTDGGGSITEVSPSYERINTLAYGIPEEQQGDFYYHSGMRKESVEKMTDDERERYSQTEAVTVNESLPAIEAKSEKQSSFAADIRNRALTSEIESAKKMIPSDKEKRAAVLANAKKNLGIQTYSDLVLYLAKNRPSSMWKRIISTTNARDIIDRKWAET